MRLLILSHTSPPRPRLTFRVGITGHRTDRLATSATDSLSEGIRSVLQEAVRSVQACQQKYANWFAPDAPELRFVSPLADGADHGHGAVGVALQQDPPLALDGQGQRAHVPRIARRVRLEARGVYAHRYALGRWFVSLAHEPAEIEQTLDAVRGAVEDLAE